MQHFETAFLIEKPSKFWDKLWSGSCFFSFFCSQILKLLSIWKFIWTFTSIFLGFGYLLRAGNVCYKSRTNYIFVGRSLLFNALIWFFSSQIWNLCQNNSIWIDFFHEEWLWIPICNLNQLNPCVTASEPPNQTKNFKSELQATELFWKFINMYKFMTSK